MLAGLRSRVAWAPLAQLTSQHDADKKLIDSARKVPRVSEEKEQLPDHLWTCVQHTQPPQLTFCRALQGVARLARQLTSSSERPSVGPSPRERSDADPLPHRANVYPAQHFPQSALPATAPLGGIPSYGGRAPDGTSAQPSPAWGVQQVPTPREMVTLLDQYVVGQAQAKKVLAVGVHVAV
jgi:hypothetical protein